MGSTVQSNMRMRKRSEEKSKGRTLDGMAGKESQQESLGRSANVQTPRG